MSNINIKKKIQKLHCETYYAKLNTSVFLYLELKIYKKEKKQNINKHFQLKEKSISLQQTYHFSYPPEFHNTIYKKNEILVKFSFILLKQITKNSAQST